MVKCFDVFCPSLKKYHLWSTHISSFQSMLISRRHVMIWWQKYHRRIDRKLWDNTARKQSSLLNKRRLRAFDLRRSDRKAISWVSPFAVTTRLPTSKKSEEDFSPETNCGGNPAPQVLVGCHVSTEPAVSMLFQMSTTNRYDRGWWMRTSHEYL